MANFAFPMLLCDTSQPEVLPMTGAQIGVAVKAHTLKPSTLSLTDAACDCRERVFQIGDSVEELNESDCRIFVCWDSRKSGSPRQQLSAGIFVIPIA
jgi:hypothetical protein